MITITLVFATVIFQHSCFGAVLPRAVSDCSISVNQHLEDPQPLLLLQNGAVSDIDAFPLPVDSKGTLKFSQGETIDLACPGTSVLLSGSSTGKAVVEARCDGGILFTVQGRSVAFNTITCTKDPYNTARYTGRKCATNYREIEIGFNINNNRFIRHLATCFDDVLQNVLYTEQSLTATIAGFQVGYPRPNFLVGSFFNVAPDSVGYLYSRKGQRKTINNILGLSSSNTSIIHPTNDYFLSTGHYAAKADFVFGAQQRITFYYVNAAPQWQTFNGGNWNTLEANVRSLASERGLDLQVYTGSYGISTLPNSNGKEQELYLWTGDGTKKGIPVPAIFFKVVYEPKSKAGIALIGINNPYKKDISGDIICKDVCDRVKWLTWKKDNQELGYSYCCEVNDFRRIITVLPAFEVNSLLVSSSSSSSSSSNSAFITPFLDIRLSCFMPFLAVIGFHIGIM